jgi:mannose-6-phosphate isomerase-like protein (cupin superfamily)
MRHGKAGSDPSGWIGGTWNWDLPVAIGYANEGIDEPHRHERQTEVYLVATGSAVARVDGVDVEVSAGDVLVIEPDEVRTFTSSSPDYRCFVLHVGGDGSPDKVPVD